MREFISITAGVILLVSMWPYIRDILKGKIKPNIVSWFTWTLLTVIGTLAAISDGAYTTAILSGAATIATATIVVLGLRDGIKHYTLFDALCQLAAFGGLALWYFTHMPELAMAIVVLIDIIACMPTIRHAWQKPHEEGWFPFASSSFCAFLTLFTITQFTFVALAYPIWLTVGNVFITWIIVHRQKQVKVKA